VLLDENQRFTGTTAIITAKRLPGGARYSEKRGQALQLTLLFLKFVNCKA
jgi:hypothetical protein